MDIIYIVFFGIIGILIAIGFGLQLSHDIEDFIIYFLFWMLYIITIITFINIILVINYYLTMKNKAGPPGRDGKLGDRGDKGDTGLCDPGCRDKICENQINDAIIQNLKDKNNGLPIKMNNTYIKSKVAQMCLSPEFKQVAGNGSQDLINYLTSIWTIWIDNIYDAGGLTYFQNIGSENDFEWIKDNPFNELKKYDVFYWGMDSNYRPKIIEKCNKTEDGTNPISTTYIFNSSTTTSYTKICDDYNSGATYNVSFWRANQYTYNGTTYYPVGDIALGPTRTNENVSIDRLVGINNIGSAVGPHRQTIIVSGDILGPIGYEYIWSNEEDNNNPFWIWEPIPPPGYIALGDVVTIDANPPLTGDSAPIRCVPESFVTKLVLNPYYNTVFWSTVGAYATTDLIIYGFTPNYDNGSFVNALPQNAYNLFRAIPGKTTFTYIPDSDPNRNFYQLKDGTYDSIQIGESKATPSIDNAEVGKGYIYDEKTDAKYSVLSYLKLKNSANLTHSQTNIELSAQIIPNAISNAYLIKSIDPTTSAITCMSTNGSTVNFSKTCDETKDSQTFSIIFTGNKTNECVIQHYKSEKILTYHTNTGYSLASKKTEYDPYQLFMMS